MSAYEKVLLARAKDRPTGLSYIENIFEDFIELHGDRRFADDPAIVGGIATLHGQPVTVIAMEKGKDMRERVRRNFGAPNPEGYRKALRLMEQAEKGGSGGALALALSDRVWILENAVYSVISPEGCASILWKDSKKVKDAAESLRLTAQDMLELGVVEQVSPEEKEFSLTYAKLQEELEAALSQLGQLPVEELLEQRYQRFRKY